MNAERELIRAGLADWDVAVVGSVRLPCMFDRAYEESLGVDGATPTALVATGDILGNEAKVSLVAGTTSLTVETVDGRTEGPFVFEVAEPEGPGTHLLRLREA